MVNPYTPTNFSLDNSPAPTAPTEWDAKPSTSNRNLYVAGIVALVAGTAAAGYVRHKRRKADAAAATVLKNEAIDAERRAADAFEAEHKRTQEIAEMEARADEMRQALEELDHKMKVRARALEMLENGEVDPAKVK